MAEDDVRFRLQVTWLRDEQGNLIAETVGDEDDKSYKDIDGIIYFSDLPIGVPYQELLNAAEEMHTTELRRIELTFKDMRIALERTEEPATIGYRAEEEQRELFPLPVRPDRTLRVGSIVKFSEDIADVKAGSYYVVSLEGDDVGLLWGGGANPPHRNQVQVPRTELERVRQ